MHFLAYKNGQQDVNFKYRWENKLLNYIIIILELVLHCYRLYPVLQKGAADTWASSLTFFNLFWTQVLLCILDEMLFNVSNRDATPSYRNK